MPSDNTTTPPERKERLISALHAEAERFRSIGKSTTDHEYAIAYLRTGEILPFMSDNYELLQAVQEDFDTVCKDYGVDL